MRFEEGNMNRVLLVILGSFTLTACSLPPSLQVASWAIDGISYLTTDKSLTDHGLSMMTKSDCALLRGLKGERICSNGLEIGDVVVASLDDGPIETDAEVTKVAEFETASGGWDVKSVNLETSDHVSNNRIQGERLLISGTRNWSDSDDANQYLVIGSFRDRNNAKRLIRRHKALGPAVMASRVKGHETYRVAVGPYSLGDKGKVHKALSKAGIKEAWSIRIEHDNWMIAGRDFMPTRQSNLAALKNGPAGS